MNGDNETKVPILSLKLDGGAYTLHHGISVRQLQAFVALEDTILAAAKDLWQQANPERSRREFTMECLDLRLTTLKKSSAAAAVEAVMRPQPPTQKGLRKNAKGRKKAGQEADRFREDGLDELAQVLEQVDADPESEGRIHSVLSAVAFGGLERMLNELLVDDATYAEITIRGRDVPSRITRVGLKRIEREARRVAAPDRLMRCFVVGRVVKVQTNGAHSEGITMEKREGEDTIRLPLPENDLAAFTGALNVRDRAKLARVNCDAWVRENGRISKVERVYGLDWIGGPNLERRLEALRRSVDQWADDGSGARRPTKSAIQRAGELVWFLTEQLGLDRPHLYTTFDGDVQAEWDFLEHNATMLLTTTRSRLRFVASWGAGASLGWAAMNLERPEDVGVATPLQYWAGDELKQHFNAALNAAAEAARG